MRELIKAQEKTAVSQAEQLLEKIQKELAELKMNEAELDKLSHTEDHILFLQVKLLRFFQFSRMDNSPCTPRTDSLAWFVTPELPVSPGSTCTVSFAPTHS